MIVAGLVFVVTFILAGILLVLFLFLFFLYRKERIKDDLQTAKVILVVALILLGLNIFVVKYDSIRYLITLDVEGASTVVVPIPNEQELIDEILLSTEGGKVRIVETERGKGLEITVISDVMIEAEVITRIWSFDHETDLVDGDDFLIHFEPIDDNATIEISRMRIIHENPLDLHSEQIFHSGRDFVQGWNEVEYEYAT